jgi:hypothetical protein
MAQGSKITEQQRIRATGVSGTVNCYLCTRWASDEADRKMYCTYFQTGYKDPEAFDYIYNNLCKGGSKASY